MYKTMQHLNDEHMRLYEWSGAGAGTLLRGAPEKSTRTHAWFAPCGILALMASLLALNGCDSKDPVEQAGEQLDLAIKEMQSEQARPQINLAPADPQDGTEAAGPTVLKPSQDRGTQPGAGLPER